MQILRLTRESPVQPKNKPLHIGLPWSLFLIPLLFLTAVASVPFAVVTGWFLRRREKKFRERMLVHNRVVEWAEVEKSLLSQKGSVIEERFSFKGPVRLWWTAEIVLDETPYKLSDCWVTMCHDKTFRPFAEWCRGRYTNPKDGRALLVCRKETPHTELERVKELAEAMSPSRWIEVASPESLRR